MNLRSTGSDAKLHQRKTMSTTSSKIRRNKKRLNVTDLKNFRKELVSKYKKSIEAKPSDPTIPSFTLQQSLDEARRRVDESKAIHDWLRQDIRAHSELELRQWDALQRKVIYNRMETLRNEGFDFKPFFERIHADKPKNIDLDCNLKEMPTPREELPIFW